MVPDVEPYLEIKLAELQHRVTDINALLSHTGRLEFPSDFPTFKSRVVASSG
jgi:hypothetical protein